MVSTLLRRGLAVTTLCVAATSQAHATIPSPYANQDADRHLWLAGAGRDLRQQTILGASHLTSLVGQQLTALVLRRDANATAYPAGAATWTVTVSASPAATYDSSSIFADNLGADAVQVFHGTVAFPASPPTVGAAATWGPADTVRVAFQTPFAYSGGRLCVDITGAAVPSQRSAAWLPDAHAVDPTGAATPIGGGCGPFAAQSYVDRYGLSVGGTATFTTGGTPNSFSFALTGQALLAPLPLASVGIGLPNSGCSVMLDPTLLMPVWLTDALTPSMGIGAWSLRIPNDSNLQGLGFTTQWLDLAQDATTDAITWSIGARHSLDMVTIEGSPNAATGRITTNLAHVLRFEHQ